MKINKNEWISNKIRKIMDEGTAKDSKQAAAIAYSYWVKLQEKHKALNNLKK